MKWRFLSCILIALLPATAAMGGYLEDADGKTIIHLSLWSVPSGLATAPSERARLESHAEFVRQYPRIFAEKYRDKYKADPAKYGRHNWDNVEIRLRQASGIAVEGVETDLLSIVADMAPDVIYVNFRKSHNYIHNGFLYPLTKPEDGYMSAMSQEELDFRINKMVWPVIRRKGPNGEVHAWAMPYEGALGKVLFYRRDVFDQHGLSYPDASWTWDDMLHACKTISDPGNGIYGLLTSGGPWEGWRLIEYLWSAGGEIMEQDEATGEWRCVFDSRAAAKALDFYTRLNTEPWIDKNGKPRRGYTSREAQEDVWVKFNNGEIGLIFDYSEEKSMSKFNPDLVGMAPVPLGPPDENGKRMRAGELNNRMLGIYSRVKEAAVRDAAWEYLLWYDSVESMRIKTRVMVEGGMGRFMNPALLKRFGYPEVMRLAPKGWWETFEIAIENSRPEPYGKNSNFAYQALTGPVHEALEMANAGLLPEDEEERLDVLQNLLRKANAEANEKMIGIITPEDQRTRRIAAAVLLIVIIVTFGMLFRKVFRTFTPESVTEHGVSSWGFRKYFWAYVILLPAVLTIFVWSYVPLAWGSIMAFQDYAIVGTSKWVWLDNFGNTLWKLDWWKSVWGSIRFCAWIVSLTFLPPVILAILLHEVPRGKLLFRTLYYLPAVISGLVTMLLWKQFYEPSEKGILNMLIMSVPAIVYIAIGAVILWIALTFAKRLHFHGSMLASLLFCVAGGATAYACYTLAEPILLAGLPDDWSAMSVADKSVEMVKRMFVNRIEKPFQWLSDPDTAMLACVIPLVWAGMGPGCLIYLAALKGIAEDFYEAGDIDGATFVDKILFIVFPILKPLLIINFIAVVIGAFNSSQFILPMTGGAADTMVADLYIFFEAYIYINFGSATSMAWMLGLMLIGFAVYQLQILSKLEFKTTGDKK